ncbi:hypothetical protein IE077_000344 [Cardiosporidium cionae]|uniref:Helicase-associated domain-containing protein n=1 Tax=Cardiosporidium cionae TaxID=476202 RepID=A0ABQ7JBU4_9APIC|nr:hypothetical protein IE077_000344 [Cardiosporidium cionae]|eukprot:KAF8821140.1 hypothetical protein IE077_000344 [Cardiosporidium cionae]
MTENTFYSDLVPPYSVPDILKRDLCSFLLQLKSLGVDSLLNLEFITPPSIHSLERALETLYSLEAIDATAKMIAPLGFLMAELPLSPMSIRLLYLSSLNKARLQACMHTLGVAEGDILTKYNIFHQTLLNRSEDSDWAGRHLVNTHTIDRAEAIVKNLKAILHSFKIDLKNSNEITAEILGKVICGAFFLNAAYKHADGKYRLCRCEHTKEMNAFSSLMMEIHPTSVLHAIQPSWVVYSEAICTGKTTYMRDVSTIHPKWLVEMAPHFYEYA